MKPTASRFATLMGSASFLTLTMPFAVQAQTAAAGSETELPEQVLVTGSLIHGTAAVGVPITNLGVQDFAETGNVTISDLFRDIPQAIVAPGPSATVAGGQNLRANRVNIRGLDANGPRSLLMVDGIRFPPQDGLCVIDPSIIPALALDRVDILPDGASATYGSDAIAGVINIVLKRGFDGGVTLLHVQAPDAGGLEYQASQLWGRTWDGGDVTLTYEWTNQAPVFGTSHSKYTLNYTPWGLDNPIPIGASVPGTISIGKPSVSSGTNCTNCWAVPHGAGVNFNPINNGIGPLTPGSASTINWAGFSANSANMGTNEIDPLKQGWEVGAEQRNSAVATFDQRLVQGISFFATGFYNNRRVEEQVNPYASNGFTNEIRTFAVPTANPYYPAGAPNNLQVSYDFALERPPIVPAYEVAERYEFGFNLDLPFNWTGQIYDSRSADNTQYEQTNVNDNAVSVALGNTVGGVTKPASVPYMNLFCDPTEFTCNSPQTLSYISANRLVGTRYSIEEKGGHFDGPLFDLPAGQVKAAVGGTYESDNVLLIAGNNVGSPPQTPLAITYDSEPYTVWAGFAQVDIPVFGDNFNLPLLRKLDLEASWRHDQYEGTLSGGTSNPKLSFNWLLDEMIGATLRGSWGTAFRFANAGEYSTTASDAYTIDNFQGQNVIPVPCVAGAASPATAAAAMVAGGLVCNSTPLGISWGGAPHAQLRSYVDPVSGQVTSREGGTALAPEKSINYSLGFELAPQFAFLRGLDVQATWYSVKINGVLQSFNTVTQQTLGDPSQTFHIILPSTVGCPVAENLSPASCAPFEKMVAAALSDSNNTLPTSQLTSVDWISDGGTIGSGFLHYEGIDWNASYDWDMGDVGAWNIGITGTYYLHQFVQNVTGGPITDYLHENIGAAGGIAQNGVETTPRMVYRARLGWSDGPYSVTGFLNYQSHFFAPWGVPSNVNFQCTAAGGSTGGGTFPCAVGNYSNIEPAWYTFDLSFGYNTGDLPANNYLKHVTLQFTVQNLMGIHPAFEYGPVTSGRNAAAYNITQPDTGRVIGLTILKDW